MKKIFASLKNKKNMTILVLSFISIYFLFRLYVLADTNQKLEDELKDTQSEVTRYNTMFQYIMRTDMDAGLDALEFWLHLEDVKTKFASSLDYDSSQVFVSEPIEDKELLETKGKDYDVAYKFEVKVTNTSDDFLFIDINDFFLFDSRENIIPYDTFSVREGGEEFTDSVYVDAGKTVKFNILFGSTEKIPAKELKLRYNGGQWQYPQKQE